MERIKKKYKINDIKFEEFNGEWEGLYHPLRDVIEVSNKFIFSSPYTFVEILTHEFAHRYMFVKGPDIQGLHGEYLAQYFAHLCNKHSKTDSYKKSKEYIQHILTNYPDTYKKITYPRKTIERVGGRLERLSRDIIPIIEYNYKILQEKEM